MVGSWLRDALRTSRRVADAAAFRHSGAVPPAPTYVIPDRHKVAAQISKQDWILASVLKFNTVNNK